MRVLKVSPWALAGLLLAGLSCPPSSFGQKKEIIQLQRDMAILQEQVRQLEKQSGERMAVLEKLIQQNLEASNKLNAAVAVIERSITKQGDEVATPVASIQSRVDQLNTHLEALRNEVAEVNSRMQKVQQEVKDIKIQLTTLPPPVPGEEGSGANAGDSSSASAALFESGLTDYQRGNYELARAQFSDYLQFYPQGARAAEAQYYLGDIAYTQEQFEEAVRLFDVVLERYPVGTISADAQYKKGMALLRMERTEEAAVEFRTLMERFPHSNVTSNAEAQLALIEGEQERDTASAPPDGAAVQ